MPMTKGYDLLEGEIGSLKTEEKIHAMCQLYEPLSKLEGTCWDGSTVSRLGGCNNPQNCDRYNRYFMNKKKQNGKTKSM